MSGVWGAASAYRVIRASGLSQALQRDHPPMDECFVALIASSAMPQVSLRARLNSAARSHHRGFQRARCQRVAAVCAVDKVNVDCSWSATA